MASVSCWASSRRRTQANFSSSPSLTPCSPLLYFQCAATPYSAVEGYALGADDRRVDALVAVGLGRRDVVLEAARHGLVHVVYHAQRVVAVRDAVHDDAEGAKVEDAVYVQLLGEHLAVDAVGVLYAPVDRGVYALVVHALLDLLFDLVHEDAQGVHARGEGVGYLLVALAVEVVEGAVLQLPFYLLHAEPVGDGSVDLHRLGGLYELLFAALVVHGAHVVQAVGYLDEDDADVLRHGDEHLAQVLGLLLLVARVLHARQLGGAELALDVVVRGGRVLYDVVQEGGDDGVLVQALLGDYLGGGDAVGDVGRAVAPLLPLVELHGVLIGGAHAAHVHGDVPREDLVLKALPALLRVHERRG